MNALAEPSSSNPDFARLLWVLRHGRGFGLYFVVCDKIAYRAGLVKAIESHYGGSIIEFDLKDRPDGEYIDKCLMAATRHQPADAPLFLYGLQTILPKGNQEKDEELRYRTVRELNWRRNVYSQLDRNLVIWLPDYAITIIARQAPDFFDWNSGVFELGIAKFEPHETISYFQQLLEGLRASGSRVEMAKILNNLELLYAALGEFELAADCYRQAVNYFHTLFSIEAFEERAVEPRQFVTIDTDAMGIQKMDIERRAALIDKTNQVRHILDRVQLQKSKASAFVLIGNQEEWPYAVAERLAFELDRASFPKPRRLRIVESEQFEPASAGNRLVELLAEYLQTDRDMKAIAKCLAGQPPSVFFIGISLEHMIDPKSLCRLLDAWEGLLFEDGNQVANQYLLLCIDSQIYPKNRPGWGMGFVGYWLKVALNFIQLKRLTRQVKRSQPQGRLLPPLQSPTAIDVEAWLADLCEGLASISPKSQAALSDYANSLFAKHRSIPHQQLAENLCDYFRDII